MSLRLYIHMWNSFLWSGYNATQLTTKHSVGSTTNMNSIFIKQNPQGWMEKKVSRRWFSYIRVVFCEGKRKKREKDRREKKKRCYNSEHWGNGIAPLTGYLLLIKFNCWDVSYWVTTLGDFSLSFAWIRVLEFDLITFCFLLFLIFFVK